MFTTAVPGVNVRAGALFKNADARNGHVNNNRTILQHVLFIREKIVIAGLHENISR